MFDTANESQERGQVGIGTLIVFIALVLVAAIAAGVLINTAGFLQTQAESTGQESTDQVTNNIQVLTATGTSISGTPTTVGQAELRVSLAPGANEIDLQDVEVQLIGSGGTTQVPAADSETLLTESSDRHTIILESLGDVSSGDGLGAGDQVDVTITTADGGQTTAVLDVPDPLDSSKEVVDL